MEQLAILAFIGIVVLGFVYANRNRKDSSGRPTKGGPGVKPVDGDGGDKE